VSSYSILVDDTDEGPYRGRKDVGPDTDAGGAGQTRVTRGAAGSRRPVTAGANGEQARRILHIARRFQSSGGGKRASAYTAGNREQQDERATRCAGVVDRGYWSRSGSLHAPRCGHLRLAHCLTAPATPSA
jgi:hypothetical protein